MNRTVLTSLALLLAGSALLAAPQAAGRPAEGPGEQSGELTGVPRLLAQAAAAWDEGRYGACHGRLQEALGRVHAKRLEALLAALPAAPDGWTTVAETPLDAASGDPFAASLAPVGSVVRRTYRRDGAGGSVEATVTADAPLAGLLRLRLANPEMLERGSRRIDLGEHPAVLVPRGGHLELTVLIAGRHVCEVVGRSLAEEELLELFDRAVVERLAAALTD